MQPVIHEFETVLTETNVNEVIERLIVGTIVAQNYNRECFGTSDLRLAVYMKNTLSTCIDKLIEVGYCPHTIFGDVLASYGYPLISPKTPGLKQAIDADFRLDMSDYERAIATGYSVFDSMKDDVHELPYR